MVPRLRHILLADDDQDHGILFRSILKKIDPQIQLSHVIDGNTLFDFLFTAIPDLIFLDLNMPCKNGFQCLDELKSSPHLKQIPVIVYSSSCQISDIQQSYIHQADFYMVKPFSVKHLESALTSIFSMDWDAGSPMNQHYFINNRFVPLTVFA